MQEQASSDGNDFTGGLKRELKDWEFLVTSDGPLLACSGAATLNQCNLHASDNYIRTCS